MIGVELVLLESRPDKKGHECATIITSGAPVLCADPELNAALVQHAFRMLTVVTCVNCGGDIEFRRGVTPRGGVSAWVHTVDGDYWCGVDSHADPGAAYYERRTA